MAGVVESLGAVVFGVLRLENSPPAGAVVVVLVADAVEVGARFPKRGF